MAVESRAGVCRARAQRDDGHIRPVGTGAGRVSIRVRARAAIGRAGERAGDAEQRRRSRVGRPLSRAPEFERVLVRGLSFWSPLPRTRGRGRNAKCPRTLPPFPACLTTNDPPRAVSFLPARAAGL